MKAFAKIMCLFVLATNLWLVSAEADAGGPTLIQSYQSSSGKTDIEYYSYDASLCGTGVMCNFRGVITVPKGFEQVEVFLSGFSLEAATQSDAVQHVAASVQKHLYDAATGNLELSVNATLQTKSGQGYAIHMSFVVILTGANVAHFTSIGSGCGGTVSCNITRSLPTAVPPGMQYIGLATQTWDVGSVSGPLLLNTLSGDIASLTVTPPTVNLDYLCMMQGGTKKKHKMFCEWGAKVIAFDPAEMERAVTWQPWGYTFLGWNVVTHPSWQEHTVIPSHQPIAGFLNVFSGLTFSYQLPPYIPGVQNAVWLIESSADDFSIDPSAKDTAVTEYGVFLGTEFGNTTSAAPYGFQASRAFGFLK